MSPQEIIVSACGSNSSSTVLHPTDSTPAINVHDLQTGSHLHSFKSSVSTRNAVSTVQSRAGSGGFVVAMQESKAVCNVWAWQKDQQHMKLHLPEKLACFSVSPNGLWAVGGSLNGHLYLWELASGSLLASFTAHYRSVAEVIFSHDSRVIISTSLDSSAHIFLVSELTDPDGATGKPYGTLGDHTLGIECIAVGQTAGVSGGRCWTGSQDGTVKVWSLHPPFDLLATFSFPSGIIPTTLAVEASEGGFYVGTDQGHIYSIPMFRRKTDGNRSTVEGGGVPEAVEDVAITVSASISSLALSIAATHLVSGTSAGEIHIHSLPSHQHVRTISSHAMPVTYISIMLLPSDMTGSSKKAASEPVMEIRPLDRTRNSTASDIQTASMVLRSRRKQYTSKKRIALPMDHVSNDEAVLQLEQENTRLKEALLRAAAVNETMWSGIVRMRS